MPKLLIAVFALLFVVPASRGQAVYSAIRTGVLQVGVAGSSFSLDYGEGREQGVMVYADFDLKYHLGIEALYRNASIITPHDIGENHLFIGPRIRFTRGRFTPYAKLLAGRATLVFQQGYNTANSSQGYLAYALGGGLDISVSRHINVRAIDYEYQEWPGFKPHGLTPTGISVGAAYVF